MLGRLESATPETPLQNAARPVRVCWQLLMAACLSLAGASCEPDRVLQVTSVEDGARGSLRAAIQRANRAVRGKVRIEIPSGTYELSRCGSDDDNVNGDLDVTTAVPVTLMATGPDVTLRQTCPGERLIDGHGAGLLSVTGLTLTGGSALERGGAVRGGAISITRARVEGNRAGTDGGGVAAETLHADDVTFTNNGAMATGGAVFASASAALERCKFEVFGASRGFAIAVTGTLTLTDSPLIGGIRSASIPYRTNIDPFNYPYPYPWPNPTNPNPVHLGEIILADRVEADRVTIGNHLRLPCGNSPAHMVSTVISAAISARVVSLVNTTYSENFDGNEPLGGCVLFGGGVLASESLSLDHATYSGRIVTPDLKVKRSMLCSTTRPTQSSDTEPSYNWIGCDFTYPSRPMPAEYQVVGMLAENGGSVPTLAPPLTSVLVDKIPASQCSQKLDARGVVRPQGAKCDIGAVEADYPAGMGPNELSLTLQAPTELLAGDGATWRVLVRNNGPNAAAPVVRLGSLPLQFSSVVADHEVYARPDYPNGTAWTFPSLAAGETATLTVTGDVIYSVPEARFEASVSGLWVQEPYEDDTVSANAAVRVDGALRLAVTPNGPYVQASVISVGPHAALLGNDEYTNNTVTFTPAPGVAVESVQFLDGSLSGSRSFPPSDEPAFAYYYTLAFDGPPPQQLGIVEIHPGPNALSGPSTLPVYYTPLSNSGN